MYMEYMRLLSALRIETYFNSFFTLLPQSTMYCASGTAGSRHRILETVQIWSPPTVTHPTLSGSWSMSHAHSFPRYSLDNAFMRLI